MSNKTLFGSATSTIITGFNTIETVMQAVNTAAMAANNIADVALITSEGYKKSAVLKQQQELAALQQEVDQVQEPVQEEDKK